MLLLTLAFFLIIIAISIIATSCYITHITFFRQDSYSMRLCIILNL
ncbi:hypothetical protein [Rummeliibacillus stabekisii]